MVCTSCNKSLNSTAFSPLELAYPAAYRCCDHCLNVFGLPTPIGQPTKADRYTLIRGFAWCTTCRLWHPVKNFYRANRLPHGLSSNCKQAENARAARRIQRTKAAQTKDSKPQRKKVKPVVQPSVDSSPPVTPAPTPNGALQCGVCQQYHASSMYYRSEQMKPAHARLCRSCVEARSIIPTLPPGTNGGEMIVRGYAWCCGCQAWEIQEHFSQNKQYAHGLARYCRSCNRSAQQKHKNGRRYTYPNGQSYESMFAQQNGLCAICHQPERAIGSSGTVKRLAVDHDHKTGIVRGLLCQNCNLGIGYFKDTPRRLAHAIVYLTNDHKDHP